MKKKLLFAILFYVCLGGAAWAQPRDGAYEARALDVVAALIRVNGLSGWEAGAPAAWPEAAFDLDGQGGNTALHRENGALFSQERPARLLGLRLSGAGLSRAADFSGLSALMSLELAGNELREINLAGTRSLRRLSLAKNQLDVLTLADAPDLMRLNVSGNRLSGLDSSLNPRLAELSASMNQLNHLDVSQNPNLVLLEAMNNRLTGLRLDQNPRLAGLSVSYNQLEELFVGHNPLLKELKARDNRLTRIDLRANPELRELSLSKNGLTDLDLSGNPRLDSLAADQNNLSILDLSANPELADIQAQENPLTEIRLSPALSGLESINVDGCRLPLSRLYPLSGLAKNRGRLGTQEKVLFEEIFLAQTNGEAALDLSSEVSFGGEATEFLVLNDKKRRLRPSEYRVEDGLVSFLKPGRYMVMMTNPAVFSSEKNRLTGRQHAIKAKVYTGIINVE